MDENHLQPSNHSTSSAIQYEDAALKMSMHFFAEELLPYFGISGRVTAIAPTELVHLDIEKLFQDYNLIMEDGSWKHFEFQSTNEGLKGLKRFRSYEALTSYQHNVSVTTYVLYSVNIQRPMTEFTEGINTYHIVPIIMQKKNADTFFAVLQQKVHSQIPLTKEDLVPLTLCLLMGGNMPLKDRILTAYKITGQTTQLDTDEIQKIEAVIYTMATKFLESMDMKEIMEGIRMTKLGQMLVNQGIEEGIRQGLEEGEQKARLEMAKNLIGLVVVAVIAKTAGLPLETIQQLKKENT